MKILKKLISLLLITSIIITFGCKSPLEKNGLEERLQGKWKMSSPSSRYGEKWEISENNWVSITHYTNRTYCHSGSETTTTCHIEFISSTEILVEACTVVEEVTSCVATNLPPWEGPEYITTVTVTTNSVDDKTYFIEFTSKDSFERTGVNSSSPSTFNRE